MLSGLKKLGLIGEFKFGSRLEIYARIGGGFVRFLPNRNHNRARRVINGLLALEIQSNMAYFS